MSNKYWSCPKCGKAYKVGNDDHRLSRQHVNQNHDVLEFTVRDHASDDNDSADDDDEEDDDEPYIFLRTILLEVTTYSNLLGLVGCAVGHTGLPGSVTLVRLMVVQSHL